MWYSIRHFGIDGAAVVWCLRIIIDSIAMFYESKKVMSMVLIPKTVLIIFISLPLPFLLLLVNDISTKFIVFAILFFCYAIITWIFILQTKEKEFLLSIIKRAKKS
jgi:hypothetical protein